MHAFEPTVPVNLGVNTNVKFLHMCKELSGTDWDIVFVGHHVRDYKAENYKKDDFPKLEKWDVYTSFSKSLGGTIGYMISKTGAKKFLDFVNANRLINCIDTALQKSACSIAPMKSRIGILYNTSSYF